jgi:diguanylate cyclase (GGDEF)-like protein/PAS domain S-box-containing protein
LSSPAIKQLGVVARPAERARRALSLQGRAALVIVLGTVAIGGFITLSVGDDSAISSDYERASQSRQLQYDNAVFMLGMVNQESSIRAYMDTANATSLGSYRLGRQQVESVRDRLRAEGEQQGVGVRADATLDYAAQWQTWAEMQRARVDAAHAPVDDPAQLAIGDDLFALMRTADAYVDAQAAAEVKSSLSMAEAKLSFDYRLLTTGGLVAITLLVLMLLYFVNRVLQPVSRLAGVAQDLADDKDVRVPASESGDEVGQLSRALAAWQYSAAERLALAQLASESESHFRLLFDRAPIGIARVDRQGRILESNPALQEMLGYGAVELSRHNIAELTHPEDREPTDAVYRELQAGVRDRLRMEQRYLRSDGKPFWGDLTVAPVRGADGQFHYFVAMVEDITARKRQEADLEHRALHDGLTDLPNRTLLFDRLQQALLTAKRDHQTMALLIVDLDGFKEINDTYGHQAGDLVLKQVAKRLRARMRDSDTVARLGGDEFALVLAGDDQAGGVEAAARLMKALEHPFNVRGRRLEVGASIGIAVFPQDGVYMDTLIRKADEAMYQAKRSGGGYVLGAPSPLVGES